MIKYRLAIKAEGKHLVIATGVVSDAGTIEVPIPPTPVGGVVVIEWEREKDE